MKIAFREVLLSFLGGLIFFFSINQWIENAALSIIVEFELYSRIVDLCDTFA